jgi:hydroxyacylglutathione hydrolase
MEWVRHESRFWQMTSLILRDGDRVVVVDPGVSTDEIEAIRAAAGPVEAVLVTHSDWDHVVGLSSFPQAEVVMADEPARAVRSGVAGAELEKRSREVGLHPVGPPRVDRVLRDGLERVGPFALEVVALPGHTACSTGFHLPELGILVVGDYLSPIEPPYVEHSAAAYRGSVSGLIDRLKNHPEIVVVPGHGEALTAARAAAIGEADLDYLAEVDRAVAAELASGMGQAAAVEAGAAVEPPRGSDLEGAYEARRRVAEVTLAEAFG